MLADGDATRWNDARKMKFSDAAIKIIMTEKKQFLKYWADKIFREECGL